MGHVVAASQLQLRADRLRPQRLAACVGEVAHLEYPSYEIVVLGDRGSRRIDTLVHDIVEASAEAGDILFTILSPEAYLTLVGERGWTPERFEAWSVEQMEALLPNSGP